MKDGKFVADAHTGFWDASKENIKSAYRNLCKIHHPDKGGNEEKFKEISEAYSRIVKSGPSSSFPCQMGASDE